MSTVSASNWFNQLAGIGVGRDKSSWFFRSTIDVSRALLDDWGSAYRSDDVVGLAVDRVPDQMFGRGVEIVDLADDGQSLETAKVNRAVTDALLEELPTPGGHDRLSLLGAVDRATRWERLFGGGAIFAGWDDGAELDTALDPRLITALKFVEVLDPRELVPDVRPGLWRAQFRKGQVLIHESRLIIFPGAPLPNREELARQGWGVGVIERVWRLIGAFQGAWLGFQSLLSESVVKRWKLRGYVAGLSRGAGVTALERIRIANASISQENAAVVDSEGEEFDILSSNIQGQADAVRTTFERLAMALGLPVIILVGISPSGLNATGDFEIRLWRQGVINKRSRSPEAAIRRLAQLIAPLVGEDPSTVAVRWPAFEEQTEDQRSESREKDAKADSAQQINLIQAVGAKWLTDLEARRIWRESQGLEADPTADEVIEAAAGIATPAPVGPIVFSTTPNAHVGEVGQRFENPALVTEARILRTVPGDGHEVRYLLDVPGGTLVWQGVGPKIEITVGETVGVRARVEGHEDVAGLKLTRISRPTFLKQEPDSATPTEQEPG